MKVVDWGIIDYKKAWDKQTELFSNLIDKKKAQHSSEDILQSQQIIFCEHPHVYTLGRNGHIENMLIQDDRLKALGATYYKTDRGGDITYHGYGQIVVYPILDLDSLGLSLKKYVCCLEEAVIQTLQSYGIEGDRIEGATGVWIESDTASVRKICAIGVRASHFVTMHGLAFNVSTDLSYYNYINPCGFVDKGVTSLDKELGYSVDISEVKEKLKENLISLLS
jgi:lipoyl(octanoyl) transferase